MKYNIIQNIGILFLAAVLSAACEDKLEEKYYNPEKSTEANLPGFLTAMFDNAFVRIEYWNVRTFICEQTSIYTQTTYFTNSNSIYQQKDGYVNDYWKAFYTEKGSIPMYRSMEMAYNDLPDDEKASQEIFMQAARVFMYDQASRMVDLFGDIPFSESGSLETTNTIINPKFDNQAELYNTFIDGLKSAAEYFSTATTNASFSRYDILINGDVKKWERYANSVRLRLLMRISKVNEAKAQSEVMEMLSNSARYPLVDGGNLGDYRPESSDILLSPLTTYTENLNDAFTDLNSRFAPDYMLNTVMLPANDPRIRVLFDKYGKTEDNKFTPNAGYAAMPVTFTQTQAESSYMLYSILDSATFMQNSAIPGIVVTASEVNFAKAEAFERWGGGDAQAAYDVAIKQSVSFYYYLNSLSNLRTPLEKPSQSEMDAFIAYPSVAYSGTTEDKLVKIWIQKWAHYGVLQSALGWAEYRRTNYPQLTFPSDGKLSGYETPPTRLLYPSSERTYNSENYEAVKAKDTRTTKIFWDVD